MTREEVEGACIKLAAEHPDRHTHRWVPHQEADGSWDVAKVALAPIDEDAGTAETRADERPPTGDDPRTNNNLGRTYSG